MAIDPMHQFRIERLVPLDLGGIDASFTNSSLFMVAAVVLIAAFTILTVSTRALVPGRWQSMAELTYEFVAKMVRDAAGESGMKFFPVVFSIFMFILFCNLLGLLPYSFTATSHIIVTAALALFVFLGVTAVGFAKHGLKFLKLFVPEGVPGALLPFVVLIEIISYFSRPVSHSIRLFANMLAGHITLKVFAGFVIGLSSLGALGVAGAALPLIMIIALTALELLVAALQAYVFTVLTCMYLNDALHPGH